MKKISIKFNENILSFSYVQEYDQVRITVNSNKSYRNELIYTDNYIKTNKQKVLNTIFLNFDNEIETIKVNSYSLFNYLFPLINALSDAKELVFDIDKSINKKIFDKLLNLNYIKEITCFYMPDEFIKKLDNKKRIVKFSNKCKFTKEFITINELNSMNDMYYKKKIIVNSNTINDFENFVKINRYTNSVLLTEINNGILNSILEIVGNKNISILIDENKNTINYLNKNIKKLKKTNKKFLNNRREIKIIYSSSYVKNNLFKQLSYNNLKI